MKYGKYAKHGMLIIESRHADYSTYSVFYNGTIIGSASSMAGAMNIVLEVGL